MKGGRTNYNKGVKMWCLTLRLTEKEYSYLNACRRGGESVQDVIKRTIYDDAYDHGEGGALE